MSGVGMEAELSGLDPCQLLDQEAERLDTFFAGLGSAGWTRSSRCDGWTVRDVLGHLLASEDYHRACLDGAVAELLAGFAERGATDLDSVNALGVSEYAALSPDATLAQWRDASADNRRRFGERGDGSVDTSVGEYPSRWQAFHVASELATHADDIAVPVVTAERDERIAWRVRFSRFALAEAKPQLEIRPQEVETFVSDGTRSLTLTDSELIEGVMGRLGDTSRFDSASRQLVSTMP